jgi:hypothetical protein
MKEAVFWGAAALAVAAILFFGYLTLATSPAERPHPAPTMCTDGPCR